MAATAVMALIVLGPPPFICIFVFKPEKHVAWHGRREQEDFYSTRMSGKKWTDEEFGAIPWRSRYRFALGAPRSKYVRNSADEPETFPRAINQVRISGFVLFVMW